MEQDCKCFRGMKAELLGCGVGVSEKNNNNNLILVARVALPLIIKEFQPTSCLNWVSAGAY